jgi:predicted permease
MDRIRTLLSRCAAFFRGRKLDEDLDEELRTHIDFAIEENLKRGLSPQDARTAALLAFGGVTQTKEAYRSQRGLPFIETAAQDIRYALRMLRKSPSFAAVVTISLGLGIGVNTTIFSFVNAAIFRPPAVERPGQLAEVWHHVRTQSGFNSFPPLSYPDFEYYRANNHVFSSMAGFESESGAVSWSHDRQSENLQGQLVSGNFFSVLGVSAALGRTISTEDDRTPGASPVAVLRYAFWQQRFVSDPNIVGQQLTLNGRQFTVIGVAARKFDGMLVGFAPDFWTPISMYREIKPARTDLLDSRETSWLMSVGRLRDGMSLEQANSELALLSGQLAIANPKTNKDLTAVVVPADLTPAPMRGLFAGISALLMAIVGVVLLIACANVVNLSLAQFVRRQGELAVRAALGAPRWRVIQQMLIESIVLGCAGGVLGVFIAMGGAPMLLALKPSFAPIFVDVTPDWRVLLFTLGLSLATGVLVGIVPALRSTRNRNVVGFNLQANGASYSKSRLRNFLVISQVAFGFLLLIVAGLCVRSRQNVRSLDPGFEVDHQLMASFDLTTAGYDQQRGEALERRLLERLGSLPGVRSVGLADHLPLGTATSQGGLKINGRIITFDFAAAGPGYFQSLGIPLRGRDFSDYDGPSASPSVIVNQAFAEQVWPNEDAIGKATPVPATKAVGRVIGVVKTGKYRSLGEEQRPFLFVALLQNYQPRSAIVVRTCGPPGAMVETVRREMAGIDPVLAVQAQTLREHLKLALFPAEAAEALLGSSGLLALALSVVGLYGMLAYSVSQRTNEIGIRAAMGAQAGEVVRLVALQGIKLAGIGMAIGLLGASLSTRLLAFLLYGVSPTDPLTFGVVTAIYLGIVLLACYIPARRATQVDPIVVLRYE